MPTTKNIYQASQGNLHARIVEISDDNTWHRPIQYFIEFWTPTSLVCQADAQELCDKIFKAVFESKKR